MYTNNNGTKVVLLFYIFPKLELEHMNPEPSFNL